MAKKITKSADAAKARAEKKDAKRSAKALKAINKPAKGLNKSSKASTPSVSRPNTVKENQMAARAAAKKRAELKAPNTRSAAEKLAMRRTPSGKLFTGRGGRGGGGASLYDLNR